eukprot:scaffold37397_cov36-Cyclotella_meneghiniana.AAC.1
MSEVRHRAGGGCVPVVKKASNGSGKADTGLVESQPHSITACATAQVRGCCSPRPPALIDMEVMSSAWGGSGSDWIARGGGCIDDIRAKKMGEFVHCAHTVHTSHALNVL